MKRHVIRNGAAGLIGAALVLSGCFGQGQGEDIGLQGQGQEQSAGKAARSWDVQRLHA